MKNENSKKEHKTNQQSSQNNGKQMVNNFMQDN